MREIEKNAVARNLPPVFILARAPSSSASRAPRFLRLFLARKCTGGGGGGFYFAPHLFTVYVVFVMVRCTRRALRQISSVSVRVRTRNDYWCVYKASAASLSVEEEQTGIPNYDGDDDYSNFTAYRAAFPSGCFGGILERSVSLELESSGNFFLWFSKLPFDTGFSSFISLDAFFAEDLYTRGAQNSQYSHFALL